MIVIEILLLGTLLIAVFLLHGKINRLDEAIRQLSKDTPPPAAPVTPAAPVAPAENAVPPPPPQQEKPVPAPTPGTPPPEQTPPPPKNETVEKFITWLCFGIQRDGVSKEYAAATTWLIRTGILILLCAVGFFLKYSIENNLVSPSVRIILTFLAAAAMFAGGLAGLNKRFHLLAIGFLSAGVVTFYMGAFAGFKIYHIIPVIPAFAIMVLTTVVSMLTAVKYKLLPIALISCAGGYLTPCLLSSNSGNLVALLAYTVLISAGVLIASRVYRWRSLEIMAFLLSFSITGMASSAMPEKITPVCLLLILLNFLVFSMIPVIRKKEITFGITEWLLPIFAGALTLLMGIDMILHRLHLPHEDLAAAGFAILISAITLTEGIYLTKKRPSGKKLLPAFLAASMVSLAVAVPLAFEDPGSITTGWSLLGFALAFACAKSKEKTLLVLSCLAFAAAFFVMLAVGDLCDGTMLSRFFCGGVFSASLLGAAWVLHKNPGETWSGEAQKCFWAVGGFAFVVYSSIEVYRQLEGCSALSGFRHGGLSVWWAVLACTLLVSGIRKNLKVLRGASLILFLACLGKIYLVDIAGLNTLHKVIAFLLTGLIFLGGAAAYILFRKRFAETARQEEGAK